MDQDRPGRPTKHPTGRILRRERRASGVFPVACLLLASARPVPAQDPPQPADPQTDPFFNVSVEAAVYRVRVTDETGRILQGLTAEDFQVKQEGKPRPIVYFREEGSAPVSVALIIDVGAPMKKVTISKARQTVFDLVHVLEPEDEVLIGMYASRVELLTGLTSDRSELVAALENLSPTTRGSRREVKNAPTQVPGGVAVQLAVTGSKSQTGWAVDEALFALKQAVHHQKAILVFSAGSPGLSESTLQHLREAEVHFFVAPVPNRLGTLLTLGTSSSLQEKSVRETGGLNFPLWQAREQIDSIRTALKSYYVISFEPLHQEGRLEGHVRIDVTGQSGARVTALPVLQERAPRR